MSEFRTLKEFPMRGKLVRAGDYISGYMAGRDGEVDFSGFVRSIMVWSDGVRIYLDGGTLKLHPKMDKDITLQSHVIKK